MLEFQNQNKVVQKFRLVKKENFEPKMKPIIENSKNELYQLENKQTKGAKPCTNIAQQLELQNIFQSA